MSQQQSRTPSHAPFDGLNAEQRAAVKHLDGPLLVLAGAGSGKTRVITQKISYLIGTCGYSPVHIAAITFTNKAAREMRERASKLLDKKATHGLTVTTFHSLGMQILRQEAPLIGYKSQFSILDAADSLHVLSDIMKTTDKAELKRVQYRISRWKNDLIAPEFAALNAENTAEQASAKLYQRYQDTLRAYQAFDFDDLIRVPVEIFQCEPEALGKWQDKLHYLLIDEYQDTNACQYQMLKLLAGPHAAFTAVGDDDQSIYAWRGANIDNLRLLRDEYPKLAVIMLEQNYRSTVRILEAANHLIAHNPKLFEKKLWSQLGYGDPIQIIANKDDDAEAETIVRRIMAQRFEARGKWSDFAVLYRGNHQARIFEEKLRAEHIPYVLSGGQSFFDRAEIKDIIAYLRLILNTDDDPAFIRAVTTPKRGIGTQTLEKLGHYAASRNISLFAAVFEAGLAAQLQIKQLETLTEFCNFINHIESRAVREPAGVVLNDMVRAIGYELHLFDSEEERIAKVRWENVTSFTDWLARKGKEDESNLIKLAQTVALLSLINDGEEETDAVRLSTLHAAKGLEFPHVFLVGAEEGILPHRESIDNGQVEEERRLMYVAVTRAQLTFTISYCEHRKRAREMQSCEPSRFIHELGSEHVRSKQSVADPVAAKQHGNDRLAQLKALLATKTSAE